MRQADSPHHLCLYSGQYTSLLLCSAGTYTHTPDDFFISGSKVDLRTYVLQTSCKQQTPWGSSEMVQKCLCLRMRVCLWGCSWSSHGGDLDWGWDTRSFFIWLSGGRSCQNSIGISSSITQKCTTPKPLCPVECSGCSLASYVWHQTQVFCVPCFSQEKA